MIPLILLKKKTLCKTHGPILGDKPKCEEIVGIVKTGAEFQPRKIIVWKKSHKEPQFIYFLDPAYKSSQYSLLFPPAAAGWFIDLRGKNNEKIIQQKYYHFLLLSEPRLTLIGHLGQEYFVNIWCRAEEEKLQFIKHN